MSDDRPVLLVTGGSRGIGAAVCRLAAADGWQVVVNYAANRKAAEQVVETIEASGGKAVSVQGDVGSAADIDTIFGFIDRTFGRLDGLVNNAGIVDNPQRLDEMSNDRLERMFRVNTLGSVLCARAAVKRMALKFGGKGGSIVNLSSMATVLGSGGQYVDYAASKGAIDTLTIGLARELAEDGIRVNAIRPGIIDTEIHASGGLPNRARDLASIIPMKRAGTADEIAESVVFLLSQKASYITGALLNVSGGR
jgi:NAD(P)-dependent dehydrogenase (short-subunit alcohol dehydrogenase family)